MLQWANVSNKNHIPPTLVPLSIYTNCYNHLMSDTIVNSSSPFKALLFYIGPYMYHGLPGLPACTFGPQLGKRLPCVLYISCMNQYDIMESVQG